MYTHNIYKAQIFFFYIIKLTLAGCIFIPYSSQRRAVSKRLRSASAGDWPLLTLKPYMFQTNSTLMEHCLLHS